MRTSWRSFLVRFRVEISPVWTCAYLVTVNIIIVLGSSRLHSELQKRFAAEKTSLGEPYSILLLDKSEGVAERDEGFMQQFCEASIKEYFFGSVGRTLSPATQQVDFDSLSIYRLGDCESHPLCLLS